MIRGRSGLKGRGGRAAFELPTWILLKLSLCDLVGAETQMVWKTENDDFFSRWLDGPEQRRFRVDGSDWPLNALTMVGLRRLDDLQLRVEELVADGVAGDLIEAGAWRGGASILMRATLDSLGETDREVWVADSFQGFPQPEPGSADDAMESDLGPIDYFAPGVDDRQGVLRAVRRRRRRRFVPGFFEQTMAGLAGRRWALIRLDADGYNATRLTLDALYGGLARGGYVVIDDYFTPGLDVCRDAVDGFRSDHGIEDPDHADGLDRSPVAQERRARARARAGGQPADPTAGQSTAHAVAEDRRRRSPSDRERLLASALDTLRERITELESQLESEPARARRKPRAGARVAATDRRERAIDQRPGGSDSARRICSREMTDWSGATPALTRSTESRSATANALESSSRLSTAS